MKTYLVYHGNRCVGSVKAYNVEQAYREANWVYRHWVGNYVVALTVKEI